MICASLADLRPTNTPPVPLAVAKTPADEAWELLQAALLMAEHRQLAAAQTQLEAISKLLPNVQDIMSAQTMRWQLQVGNAAEAERTGLKWLRLYPRSHLGAEVRLWLADCAYMQDQPRLAFERYALALPANLGAMRLHAFAATIGQLNWSRLHQRHRELPSKLRRMAKLFPWMSSHVPSQTLLPEQLGVPVLLRQIDQRLQQRDLEESAHLLALAKSRPLTAAQQQQLEIRQAWLWYRQHKLAQAAGLLEQLWQQQKTSQIALKLASVYQAQHLPHKVPPLWASLLHGNANKKQRQQYHRLWAESLMRANQFGESLAAWRSLPVKNKQHCALSGHVWWLQWQQQDVAAAQHSLQQAYGCSSSYRQIWQMYLAYRLGDEAELQAWCRRRPSPILPYTYEGYLSNVWCQTMPPWPTASTFANEREDGDNNWAQKLLEMDTSQTIRLDWLYRLGWFGAYYAEINKMRAPAVPSWQKQLAQATLFAEHFPDQSYQMASPHLLTCSRQSEKWYRRCLQLAYPRAYLAWVEQAAATYRVDKYLLWAIMRQESGFNLLAISNAAATGPMQIIPTTAQHLANDLAFSDTRADTLIQPPIGIALSAWYLRQLLTHFHQNLVLSIAAYNAGEAAVSRWVANAPNAYFVDFIENIPWRETQTYVKNVLANWQTYHGLYTSEALPPLVESVGVENNANAMF